jgi:hypothetical protein
MSCNIYATRKYFVPMVILKNVILN